MGVVVVVASGGNQCQSMARVDESFVPALVPQAAVEALGAAVRHLFPRRDDMPFNPALFLPSSGSLSRKMAARCLRLS